MDGVDRQGGGDLTSHDARCLSTHGRKFDDVDIARKDPGPRADPRRRAPARYALTSWRLPVLA
jgi:hypothetical protein